MPFDKLFLSIIVAITTMKILMGVFRKIIASLLQQMHWIVHMGLRDYVKSRWHK